MDPQTTAEQIVNNLKHWIDNPEAIKHIGFFCTTMIILSNPHSNPFNTNPVTSTMDFWTEVQEKIKNYEFKN